MSNLTWGEPRPLYVGPDLAAQVIEEWGNVDTANMVCMGLGKGAEEAVVHPAVQALLKSLSVAVSGTKPQVAESENGTLYMLFLIPQFGREQAIMALVQGIVEAMDLTDAEYTLGTSTDEWDWGTATLNTPAGEA